MESPQDTIAAIATPLGEAGLGVLRLSGASAITVANQLFRSSKLSDLNEAPTHTCYVGTIVSPSPAPSGHPLPLGRGPTSSERLAFSLQGEGGRRPDEGKTIDQVVVTVFRAPNSYTGEDVVEISAHGSPFVLQDILNLCLRHGARLAGPGEFTQRAFLNGKLDLTQAEAVIDLIHARTGKTRDAALAQLRGSLAAEVRGLRDQLLPILAHIEVGLDHSDEDHEFLRRDQLIKKCRGVLSRIDSILDSSRTSKILRNGLRVALIGRPNVGKSSLLNALLREERAIVTPIAGTTRDTLEESVNWDGLPVVLTDTAGIRNSAQDPVERLGIERTHQAVAESDVVVGLFDVSEPLREDDYQVVEACSAKPHLWVMTKADLPASWEVGELSRLNGHARVVPLSSKTGVGLDQLVKTVKGLALHEQAQTGSALWLLNTRHQSALERAKVALQQAVSASEANDFEECVAMELQSALQALGEIIGETATEDLLDQIFSQFCVGK